MPIPSREDVLGHVKGEGPHLETIDDPAVLEAELTRIRVEYNGVRLHQAIGYVTLDDDLAPPADSEQELVADAYPFGRRWR